jgi:hypothetical protein
MNSGNRLEIMEKSHINQQLEGMNLLAGYLMGLCASWQKSGACKKRNASNPARN